MSYRASRTTDSGCLRSDHQTWIVSYFTDSDILKSWLAADAEVEPQVGGKYELLGESYDRENNSTIGCRINTVV